MPMPRHHQTFEEDFAGSRPGDEVLPARSAHAFAWQALTRNPGPFNGGSAIVPPPDAQPIDGVAPEKYLALWCGLSWNQGNANYNQAPVGTPMVLTYSFMTALPAYYTDPALTGNPLASRIDVAMDGFQPFTDAQKAAVRMILNAIAAATGLSFIEVPDSVGGELSFGKHLFSGDMADKAGYAYLPYVDQGVMPEDPASSANLSQQGIPGDVFLRADTYADDPLLPGTDGFAVLLHEIAHALGLSHPAGLSEEEHGFPFTVMAEERSSDMPTGYGSYDLAALKYLYGTDALEVERAAAVVRTYDAALFRVHHAGGDGDDIVVGTDLVDAVSGGDGNDQVWARGGDDLVDGGAGDDRLDGGIGNDIVRGGAGNDFLQGGFGSDTLEGGSGEDWLDGGAGADVLIGQGDGDVLVGYAWSSRVFDTADYSGATAGVTVRLGTSMAYGSDGLNHDGTGGYFHLIGSAQIAGMETRDTLININRIVGSQYGDLIVDSALLSEDDILIGGGGDDVLISHGGSDRAGGGDVLIGGDGADLFKVFFRWSGQGNVTVADFDAAAGDRIALKGWEQVASVSAVADGTLLSLTTGNTITLTGIDPRAVDAGWFIDAGWMAGD